MEIVAEFSERIQQALDSNELVLPSQPEVALKIRETADNPEVTVQALAEVIAQDPAITARLIRVANSPLMRGRVEVEGIQTAISRLGVSFACNLATGMAMEQIFQASNPVIDHLMRKSWLHSTNVTAMTQVLCSKVGGIPLEQGTLAGLLHRIGALPVLTFFDENPNLVTGPEQVLATIEHAHTKLGEAILTSWEFPSDIALVPSHYTDYQREISDCDLVDLVTVAHLEVTGLDLSPDTIIVAKAYQRVGVQPGCLKTDEQLYAKYNDFLSILSES